MRKSDPSVSVTCDGELVVFSDNANFPLARPEAVTLPLTADTSRPHILIPGSELAAARQYKRKNTGKKKGRSSR
jgi:hypothetical protein